MPPFPDEVPMTILRRPSRRIAAVALGAVAALALTSCEAGWVGTVAGDGTAGTTTATVPDAQARFTYPAGVVAIPTGGSYVYDTNACAIYKELNGQISVYAGTPGTCGDHDDVSGSATLANLDNVAAVTVSPLAALHGPGSDESSQITVDPSGNLYFVQSTVTGTVTLPGMTPLPTYASKIRRITPGGTISTVGTPIASSPADLITGVTTTPNGTVLVASVHGSVSHIDSIAPNGTQTLVTSTSKLVVGIAAISDTEVAVLTTSDIARVDLGTGTATSTGVAISQLQGSIAAAPDGTIYVGNNSANTITAIAPDNTTRVIGGDGTADPGTGTQSGASLTLHLTPTGLALTPNNGLLISSGHVVYRLADPAHTNPVPAS